VAAVPLTEEPGGEHTELPVLGPVGRRFHRNPPLRKNVTVCSHRAIRTTLSYSRKGIGKNWSGIKSARNVPWQTTLSPEMTVFLTVSPRGPEDPGNVREITAPGTEGRKMEQPGGVFPTPGGITNQNSNSLIIPCNYSGQKRDKKKLLTQSRPRSVSNGIGCGTEKARKDFVTCRSFRFSLRPLRLGANIFL